MWTPDRDGGKDLLDELLPYRSEYVRLNVECGRSDSEPVAAVFGYEAAAPVFSQPQR